MSYEKNDNDNDSNGNVDYIRISKPRDNIRWKQS